MTLLHEAVEDKKLDVRMVERNIARGVVSHDEHQKAVAKLPDDDDNAEYISIEEIAQDDSEQSMDNGQSTHH